MKEKRDVVEKEITFLKVEVTKLAKEKEEEKATRINGWNRLNNLVEEKKKTDEQYKTEIAQLQRDIDELKNHLVSVTKYDVCFYFIINHALNCTSKFTTLSSVVSYGTHLLQFRFVRNVIKNIRIL